MRVFIALAVGLFSLAVRAEGARELSGVEGWEGPGAWRLGGGVSWTSPVALDFGMPFGVYVEGLRRLENQPLLYGVRLAFSQTTESDERWVLRHQHLLAALLVRVETSKGPGLLFLQAGAGAMPILERARRHQFERLQALGLENIEQTSWTLAPWTWLEGGLGVRVRGGLSAHVSLGPTLGLVEERLVLGLQGMLGVSHAF